MPQSVPPAGRHEAVPTQLPEVQKVPSLQHAPEVGTQVPPQHCSLPLQMLLPQQVCFGPRHALALAQHAPPLESQHKPAHGELQVPVLAFPPPHAQLRI